MADTKCNTDGKMIAFLGPNEAGKTTVLRALDWFSNGVGELPHLARNKNNAPPDDASVVEITYWLEPADLRTIEELGLADLPSTYTRGRRADGDYVSWLTPEGRRDPEPFEHARHLFASALAAEPVYDEDDDESEPRLANWAATVEKALADSEGEWDDDWDVDYEQARSYLGMRGSEDAANALTLVRETLRADHPAWIARTRLKARAPRFVAFTQEDRELRSSYDLAEPSLRDKPPKALANLAWVAGLDLPDLWEAIESGSTRNARTAERRANDVLRERLGPRWRQKQLDVLLNVSGTNLEILISEHAEDGADTPVEERSDGLQTFIALVAFLARHNFKVPPVLLVDEIETHLHYDAQADLVEVLTRDVGATQVFYTTHSPGCLPRDLGTGIRLVAPIEGRSDASRLRNDFWTSDGPGFTPLLFAMGAGAAAFSAFRKAVLTEGAGDMILLPSLMRLATGRSDLDFQVAPGIANYHGSGLELEEVAARVVYLVDGDQGGCDHERRLRDMGIPEGRIKQFPAPKATEDYVHPDIYLGLLNDLLRLAGCKDSIRLDELDKAVSIGKAVELWCAERAVSPPGKTVVASQLVAEPGGLRLADGAKAELTALHSDIMKSLNAKPSRR